MKELTRLLSCPSEEIEKSVVNMSEQEIVALAKQLLTIADVFKSAQARTLLLNKIANVDSRLETIERKCQLGDYKPGVRRSIEAQDDESKPPSQWLSVTETLL